LLNDEEDTEMMDFIVDSYLLNNCDADDDGSSEDDGNSSSDDGSSNDEEGTVDELLDLEVVMEEGFLISI
jgi:hypothetical protein